MATSDNNPVRLVLSTCPDGDTAQQFARTLVDARLAACVNILSDIESVYRWQGEIQIEAEVLMIIKTTEPRLGALESWLQANHPYDVPEFLVLPLLGGSRDYLSWVMSETG